MADEKYDVASPMFLYLTLIYTVTALVVTAFRLAVRKTSRWWWDDFFVVVGCVAVVLQCIVLWLRILRVPVLMHNLTANIAVFYVNSLCLYLEDWMARLSILWSIVRIAPSDLTRIRLKLLSILFVLLLIGTGVVIIATCEQDPSWHTERIPPRCKLGTATPIYRIVTGIFADVILVLMPIRILRGLKSAPRLKRRLIIIFVSSLFMTIACIVQSTVTIVRANDPELVANLTEGFVALITCNLTIVVTALFRLLGGKNGLEIDNGRTGFTQPPSAIQFRTFSIQGASAKSDSPGLGASDSGFNNFDSRTGLTSTYTEDDRRTQKSDDEDMIIRSEVLEISSSNRPTHSFLERWRNLDVDDDEP